MAKTPPAKTKPSSKTAPAAKSGNGASTAHARIDLDRLAAMLDALPSLDETTRAAFRSQFTDDQCRELGATTRAAVVELEAMGMARTAWDFLLGPRTALVRYTPERLAWLLTCLGELVAARGDDLAARNKAASSRSGRSLAETAAQRVLGELHLALRDVVVGRDDLAKALDTAGDSVTPTSDTAGALDAYANVLDAWLRGKDRALHALLRGANLGAEDVIRAREAASALRRERDASQSLGSARYDSAAVNAIEGRVLFELRLLRKTFGRAAERTGDPTIPTIRVSPNLRRVFALTADTPADGSPAPAPPVPPG